MTVAPDFQIDLKRPPAHWTKEGATDKLEAWTYGGFTAVSRVAMRKEADPPTYFWWLEVLKWGRRPTDAQCARALKAFGMGAAEEARETPGPSRHFMLPVQMG